MRDCMNGLYGNVIKAKSNFLNNKVSLELDFDVVCMLLIYR